MCGLGDGLGMGCTLHQRLRTTTVYVTHDQIEAMTMADRIVVMREGVIEQVGTPLQLYDQPRNAFVAQFIGSPSMNLVAARSAAHGQVQTDDGLLLPVPPGLALPAGRELLLGIRPEHLRIAAQPGAPGWQAQVEVVEPTGAEIQVTARLGSRQLMSIARERLLLAPGQRLALQAERQHWHVFDRHSGERLELAAS